MSCRKYEILLPEYAAGRLGRPETEELEEHLSSCAGCREELASIEHLFEAAASGAAEEPAVPDGYFEQVWPDLYSRIQDEGLNERQPTVRERLRALVPFRRLPGFQAVNLVLISLVCILLFLINTNHIDRGTPDTNRPQLAQQQETPGHPEESDNAGAADREREDTDRLAGKSLGQATENLEQLGQYLDPAKQREMYESLTDFLAKKIISIEELGLTSVEHETIKPERSMS